jgi:Asp-tRNA(Asn)/Glu-tRNA(Gln) amidotransferase A subunit family amidase
MDTATVVRRLDEAGAVLVAKLTLGELAMGDTWFGGMTRNPWNLEQGSSGSSAGSAAATAAGLVWFSLGSETLGSISSPSTRCGTTGLRPTFGRVPRTGAMPLSWSMDKIGPICRSVEDCALVLEAIRGPDGQDMSVHTAGLGWDAELDVRKLRVGYFEKLFSAESQHQAFDQATLATLKSLGIDLIPVELPEVPYAAMRIILRAEAAASFDELTRSGRDAELAQQGPDAWPNTFRTARFIPAVDYVNANRVRSMAIERWADLFAELDVIVAPTNSAQLLATNLTGHPAVILPNGFRENGTPVSITFLGDLFEEGNMLAVARAYQEATDFHLKRPALS